MGRFLSLATLLLMVLTLAACAEGEGGTALTVRSVMYESIIVDEAAGVICQIDYVLEEWDLRPMVKEADLVLVGEVVSQERFGLATLLVWSEVKVSQVSRGSYKSDTVMVLHNRSCPIFIGDEYLLVLKSAQRYDEGYQVMGGHHGIFRQLDGEIQVTDAGFVPEIEKRFGGKHFTIYDLAKWFKKF